MDADSSTPHNHLLLVDDDRSTRRIVSFVLCNLGYQVEAAESALEARQLIQKFGFDHFDLVLSDYWMPGQNGLELLKYISSEDPTLSVILMTSDGERKILEKLIEINGCGFLQKPIIKDNLRKCVDDASAKTRRLRHLRATESQANTLGENQRILQQKQLNGEWANIEFTFSSKSQASGDFVSIIPLQSGEKVLLLSDASGHELSSALQSNYFHGLARGMLKHGASLSQVFEHFNAILLEEWNDDSLIGHSLAAIALNFNREEQSLSFINAGAPHPYFSKADGFASKVGERESFAPLGWFADPFETSQTDLEPGYICAWTDGLSDLAESIGIDPLSLADRLLNKNLSSSSLLSQAQDDIAIIRVTPPCTPADFHPMVPLISLDLTGDQVGQIDHIQAYCEKSIRIVAPQIDCAYLADLLVCLREALINALQHGCQASPHKSATLRLARSPDLSKISIQIQDEGDGHDFDWETHAQAAADTLIPEHRGLIMMHSIPSRIDFFEQGSRVQMEFEHDTSLN
ncbi:response regulator [Pelagicoccus sp. SDUM812005]|uniref:response regulator n=1 Tax=Pelagicoccus sp. SDUM812005 TaxID=3041257 RepID=UPI00280F6B05|nr:response regulator [Pelagicoccus sp. SDUM812005]MDQ8181257.1 response regulator [Pelagicoccus sp. SDUM812005]